MKSKMQVWVNKIWTVYILPEDDSGVGAAGEGAGAGADTGEGAEAVPVI